ncbi:enoyl-CoA hydratase-related protein [Marinomonas sp. S3726]|uniref:enoyl-CoA hydratase/isomerase family protein n=1 Tax=Marinomonas sp. S3726 TaxID=579484 RepID=UPI000A016189|nr:enoyl-CoA hydratase-related protein [Marinomonas sp. S3726]
MQTPLANKEFDHTNTINALADTFENIRLACLETGVYQICINRPKVLNALNLQCLEELNACLDLIERNSDVRVLLVTGAGEKAFVAGADIAYMKQLSAQEAEDFSAYGNQTFSRFSQLKVPVIALVKGYALGGGCELALSCDFILASDKACFAQPEVNLAILPGFGGSQRLTRRLGLSLALELVMTGRNIKSDEALKLGLVNHVYPADSLNEAGLELAKGLTHKSPYALAAIKQLMHQGENIPLDQALKLESQSFALTFAGNDREVAMQAFLDKSQASFRSLQKTS